MSEAVNRELYIALRRNLSERSLLRRLGLTKKVMLANLEESGLEQLAEDLISALNMNKSFLLPPRFAMMRTANDPGAIAERPHIREDAAAFAAGMMEELTAPDR